MRVRRVTRTGAAYWAGARRSRVVCGAGGSRPSTRPPLVPRFRFGVRWGAFAWCVPAYCFVVKNFAVKNAVREATPL